MPTNVTGPGGQLCADPKPSTDEDAFQVQNNSEQYYNSPYYLANKSRVQPIPSSRPGASQNLKLADFLPASLISTITQAGSITFHAVGDTGAAKTSRSQNAATSIAEEGAVADAMVAEIAAGGSNAPSFFFHLGDVVYNFGEAQYYYDQFYEPFREYDRPIFAIPGNHDGMVFGATSSAPQVPTLAAFLINFCASKATPSPDALTITRSVMTQPGVYFTLDAPFVSIIGLYSNVLDTGGGVISSQGGHYPLSDEQLTFLTSELQRLKPDRQAGKRAVLVAVHHPPLSCDAKTGGSAGLMADIDACCQKAGLWPDALLSGHAHLYQRFTRNKNNRQVPYIVAGSGGFAATAPMGNAPPAGTTVGDHSLAVSPIVQFGFLSITTDAKTMTFTFKEAPRLKPVVVADSITLDLTTGKITTGSAPTPPAKPVKPAKKSTGKTPAKKAPAKKAPANKPPAKKSSKKR
ncbi:MAG TPA: metallophosphoesterase [Terracidiphilus sp.]|nr:metallophosphoesterase [Terracidiphilus sp.]